MEIISSESNYGFALNDYPDSLGFILVRSNINNVSKALATALKGSIANTGICSELESEDIDSDPLFDSTIERDEFNSTRIVRNKLLLWQYTGHEWSMFLFNGGKEYLPHMLSQFLETDCIYLEYEDTSGWIAYTLFRNGIDIESYGFGPDYSELEEMSMDSESESPQIRSGDDKYTYSVDVTDGDGHYLFSSNLRTVAEQEINKPDMFLNQTFIFHQAWLPGWEDFPITGKTIPVKCRHKASFALIEFLGVL